MGIVFFFFKSFEGDLADYHKILYEDLELTLLWRIIVLEMDLRVNRQSKNESWRICWNLLVTKIRLIFNCSYV